ncbi:MAG: hypothetical protein ACKO1F_12615 [Flammeovirgaceae bacterium]
MNWLIKITNQPQPEVWTEEKIEQMEWKCYYGAKPNWVKLHSIEAEGINKSVTFQSLN